MVADEETELDAVEETVDEADVESVEDAVEDAVVENEVISHPNSPLENRVMARLSTETANEHSSKLAAFTSTYFDSKQLNCIVNPSGYSDCSAINELNACMVAAHASFFVVNTCSSSSTGRPTPVSQFTTVCEV